MTDKTFSRDEVNALMIQGTGSNVGKSVLVAGLCRAARNRGLKVLPFKPQNMSNNAAVGRCDDGGGGEMGQAQWLQALACGVPAHVDMNPVLLKPQSQTGVQIVVHGRVKASATAREYQAMRCRLLGSVMESFDRLRKQADIVLVEGAGSPAEINLREEDIANMGFALAANVPVVLAGDIDRGGVIASLVGSHTVLDNNDRNQIKGFLVNKFRGDIGLFNEGRRQIVEFTGWRDFGVLPWLDVVACLPEEDSVWLSVGNGNGTRGAKTGNVRIVVPVTDNIANFDDLNPLAMERDVELIFVRKGRKIPQDARLIVLAGSKSTISDMAEMKANGWAQQIREYAQNGGQIIGICGGYQMLGSIIGDPEKIEGDRKKTAGLGLLDVKTELKAEKIVQTSKALSVEYASELSGYEIHLGITKGVDCARPMIEINGVPHGARSDDGRVRGCYLHGIFANDAYRAKLIQSLGGKSDGESYLVEIERSLDKLAEEMEKHLDVDGLLRLAKGKKFKA